MATDKRILLCVAIAATTTAQAQVDLSARDAAMTRGSITYHKFQAPVSRDVTLIYSADGRHAERFDNIDKAGKVTSTDIAVQGKDWKLTEIISDGSPPFGHSDNVSFGGIDHGSDKASEGISWMPSLALAGGLSKLRAPNTRTPHIAEGDLSDGANANAMTRVRAIFGALESKGIPDRIEMSRFGKIYQVWVFKGASNAGNIYVPKHVEMQTRGGKVIASFDIKSADFSKQPTDAALTTNWLHDSARYYSPYGGIEGSYESILAANHGNKATTPDEYLAEAKAEFDEQPPMTAISYGPPPDPDHILGMTRPLFKYEVSVFVLTCAAVALAVLLKRKFAR
jgi:hypothetical protein